MAKPKYQGKIDILLDIKPSQLESMTRRDLARVVTRLRDAGQKRLKRIEAAGVYSPSAEYIKRTGGFKQIRGMNITELRNEYLRLKGFIGSKTGTVKGAKQYQKKQQKLIMEMAEAARGIPGGAQTVGKNIEEMLPEGSWGQVWELIDRAAEAHMINRLRYENYVGIAAQVIHSAYTKDKDALFKAFADRISAEYEELKKEDPALVNPSDLFNG